MQITSRFTIAVHMLTAIDCFKEPEKNQQLSGWKYRSKPGHCPQCDGTAQGSGAYQLQPGPKWHESEKGFEGYNFL